MKQFILEVWGDFACFTRPELKVERFSYPVITPSAARAIFDSIYLRYEPQGRPLFRWQVRRIEVLSPITYIELSRSEVKGKVSVKKVRGCMRSGKPFEPIFANARGPGSESSGRTQRQTIALRNVRYRLHAEAHLYKEDALTRKVVERIFERRAQRGAYADRKWAGC